jgi:hypothetical protein
MRRSVWITFGSRPSSALPALVLAVLSICASSTAALPEEARGRVAVLPVHDRSTAAAPLFEIHRALEFRFWQQGFATLSQEDLEGFMRRHRMRYTAGLSQQMSKVLAEEMGVQAVLISSLDLYKDTYPPKVGITARLVSTGPAPQILWMDSSAEAGDQSPGFLDLGLVEDVTVLVDRVTTRLAYSAIQTALASTENAPKGGARRFRPKVSFRSPGATILGDGSRPFAVLPLANESTRRYSGEIVTDLLVRSLVDAGVPVLEPGVVRQVLLETRQIQPKGPSIPQVDLLRVNLGVDRILFGEVGEYLEAAAGNLHPEVDFSLRVIDAESQQVIFASVSHTRGNDQVFFFDAGEISTAQDLAGRMTQALVMALSKQRDRRARTDSSKLSSRRSAFVQPDDQSKAVRLDGRFVMPSQTLAARVNSLSPAYGDWYPLFQEQETNQDLP